MIDLRVAVVHYWLLGYAGGERVVRALLDVFPQADVYTLVADERTAARFAPHRITTSWVQHLPLSRRFHRHLLPLYPGALRRFDLSGYDLVISSESGPAKGVRVPPEACHVCYCHSPMRYLWDQYETYARGMSPLTRAVFAATVRRLRPWDVATAAGVDHFVANSRNVAGRIRRCYGREAEVIYPPVNVAAGYLAAAAGDYYLFVGRLVDYKRADLAVEACSRLGRRLRVVGDGPEYRRLRRAASSQVEFLGTLDDAALAEQYAHCRALLFPADEDFGMVPVEAHSFGRPVIALGRGGALESVVGPTVGDATGAVPVDASCNGIFFAEQTVESLAEAIRVFESVERRLSPADMARGATRFSADRFRREITEFIEARLGEHREQTSRRATVPAGGAR